MKVLQKSLIIMLAAQMAQATQSGDSGSGTTTNGPAGTVSSVNQNASGAQSSNQNGSAMSMVMGGGLAISGYSALSSQNYGTGIMLLGMAALSFMQSGAHDDAASGAGLTAAGSNGQSTRATSNTVKLDSVKPTLDALKKGVNGVTADLTKGTISANGKNYSASDFASASSMQAAGFKPDDIANALAIAAKIEKKVTDKMGTANGFDEGGGAGGGVSIVDDPNASAGLGGAGKGLGSAADRGPAAVAGMTKDFNGEPIGVAGDSIFEMMNRRYILKEKQNAFINETDLLLKQK